MTAGTTFGMASEPFRAGDFEIVETNHGPNLRLRRHDHEPATMVIVEEGHFQETVGQQSFECSPGSILVKPGGAHHSNRYGEAGSRALLVVLPQTWTIRDRRCFRNAAVMRRLSLELRYRDAASSLAAECLLVELLSGPAPKEVTHGGPPPWLGLLEERLRCDSVTGLSALAALAGRDGSHVAREFRRHYGCSPGTYARSARIVRSCLALRRSKGSLSSIALAAGFYDQSHFTNVFRRLVGTTPADYRRRTRQPGINEERE